MAARKQHYVPQFYLRGFADRDKLFVVDARARKSFHTSPDNIAAERDFNRIEIEGLEPDAIEKALANFEGEIAPALERVRRSRSLEDAVDRNAVVNLICALALRNPRKRESIDRIVGDMLQAMAELTLATKERWESQVAQMKADGAWKEDTETDYETLKDQVSKKQFKFGMAKTEHIKLELEHFGEMLPYFEARKWMLLKAKMGTGGFVTVDHPVCLRWTKNDGRSRLYGPGYGVADTDILFPLSSNLALIGRFDGREGAVDADFFSVSSYNTAVIGHASRQIYARDDQYSYLRPFPQPIGRGFSLLDDPKLKERED